MSATLSLKTKKIESARVSYSGSHELQNALTEILTDEAKHFLVSLHLRFGHQRLKLLERRRTRAAEWKAGKPMGFLPETAWVREAGWRVAPAPKDLRVRHVEITGPAEAKMMINALNSGADAFMADLEDSLSPTWANVIRGQQCIRQAINGTLTYTAETGRKYLLQPGGNTTLLVRPRGWHLSEQNFLVNGEAISASLFDFGLFFFHNARALLARGSQPSLYLPKMESHLEARLWNDIFIFAQQASGIPEGTIRATVLIETIPAAFEMDEILYELRDHASGLNAGRWDYLFSVLKRVPLNAPFPDRQVLTMDLPFLRSYCELLVQTCHRRMAHAMGGMSAYIPTRRDVLANTRALTQVQLDKAREISQGFDGTWVAHPDLVAPVKTQFQEKLRGSADQKQIIPIRKFQAADLLPSTLPGAVTEAGIRTNTEVALTYLHHWLDGQGAVAIHSLMEDAATAEISRAQLWQWVHGQVETREKMKLGPARFRIILDEELESLSRRELLSGARREDLKNLMEDMVLSDHLEEFVTLPAYDVLQNQTHG